MKRCYPILAAVLFLCVTSMNAQDRREPQSVDQYLDEGRTIVIARCVSMGAVKANLVADAQVQILQVLKGAEKSREITITSRFGLEPGGVYLLRTENEARPDERYFYTASRADAVQLSPYEDLERLKTLPLRIQVIRIFNGRTDDLESEIRRLTYERDALAQVLRKQ